MLTGALFALAMKEAGKEGLTAVAASVALGGALALAIEVAQVAITGRVADMTSVVMALIGSAAGAAVVSWSTQRTPRQWAGPALVVWVLVVTLAAWTPPHLAAPGSRSFACAAALAVLVLLSAYRRVRSGRSAEPGDELHSARGVARGQEPSAPVVACPRRRPRARAGAGSRSVRARRADRGDHRRPLGRWRCATRRPARHRAVAIRHSSAGPARYRIASFSSR